jgi:hypothetical protein
MPVRFVNQSAKVYLARKGPSSVFGREVDQRERLAEEGAVNWFDRVWDLSLCKEVAGAEECDVEFVREHVPPYSQAFINPAEKHRQFRLSGCLFICQLSDPESCDQLWFILSSSGDPRSLFVKFPTVAERAAFDKTADELGWKSEELGLKILRDFLETVSHGKLGRR